MIPSLLSSSQYPHTFIPGTRVRSFHNCTCYWRLEISLTVKVSLDAHASAATASSRFICSWGWGNPS